MQISQPSTNDEKSNDGYESISSGDRSTIGLAGGAVGGELARLVVVAAVTAATLGYDVGIMAAAIRPIEREMALSGVQKELAMGSLNFVAALGAVLGGPVADERGRKPTVRLCCWLFVAGTLCMCLAPGYGALLLGRIVTGVGVGVSFVAAPVYISEVAPPDRRGQLNTVFDVAINGGILLGYVVGYIIEVLPFPDESDTLKWRIMIGFGLLMPLIVLCSISTLPESPRWLMLVGQNAAAASALLRLGTSYGECETTIEAIEKELQEEREEEASAAPSKWRLPFTMGPGQRLAVLLGFWQQATGTEAVLYYSGDFLARAGLDSPSKRLLGNVFVGVSKLVPELIAMRFVDKIGRRPLLLASSVAVMLSLASLSAAFWFAVQPAAIVVLLCGVMAAFSSGLGPFTFLLASENLALNQRASGMTLCAASNRCTSGAVAMSAVSLCQLLGDAGFFAAYAAIGVVSLAFYISVPETAGQTLEELSSKARRPASEDSRVHRSDVEATADAFI